MRILFICHGNICRSAMAEYIMKSKTNKFDIISRATTTEEIGNDIYPPAKRCLDLHKIPYKRHFAKKVTIDELNAADVILVMDEENMYHIRNYFNYQKSNVYMLYSFTGRYKEISDPWYTNDFELTYKELDYSIDCLIKYLDSSYSMSFIHFINKFKLNGCISLITDKEKIIHEASYGYKIRDKELINHDTIFKVASISKVFVALGIMKLYEEGKLDLKEDISKYLGFNLRNHFYPDKVITIEMVMTQTSSLHDCGEDIRGYYGSSCGNIFVPLKDVLMNPNSKYYHPDVFSNNIPGSTFDYANVGCGVLACIIENISGKRFNDYIKEFILKPLHINSGFRVEDFDKEKLAVHYEYSNNSYHVYNDYDGFKKCQTNLFPLENNYNGSAGGLYISSYDLSKVMLMLMNNGVYKNTRLFKEETIKYMKEIHWSGSSYDNAYKMKGLQLLILDGYGKRLRGHFGNAYGLRAFMLFNEDNGFIFIANGGDYLSFDEHLTPLLSDVLKFMTNYMEEEE